MSSVGTAADPLDGDVLVLGIGNPVENHDVDRLAVEVVDRDLEAAKVGLAGGEYAGLARPPFKDRPHDVNAIVDAETEIDRLAWVGEGHRTIADEGAVAEERDLAGKERRAGLRSERRLEVGSIGEHRHRTNRERHVDMFGRDLQRAGADPGFDRDTARYTIFGAEIAEVSGGFDEFRGGVEHAGVALRDGLWRGRRREGVRRDVAGCFRPAAQFLRVIETYEEWIELGSCSAARGLCRR